MIDLIIINTKNLFFDTKTKQTSIPLKVGFLDLF